MTTISILFCLTKTPIVKNENRKTVLLVAPVKKHSMESFPHATLAQKEWFDNDALARLSKVVVMPFFHVVIFLKHYYINYKLKGRKKRGKLVDTVFSLTKFVECKTVNGA